jgi:hypothetical protein
MVGSERIWRRNGVRLGDDKELGKEGIECGGGNG